MGILNELNPFKKNYEKKSIADLKIAEGNMMKKIQAATEELSKLNQELESIRNIIEERAK